MPIDVCTPYFLPGVGTVSETVKTMLQPNIKLNGGDHQVWFSSMIEHMSVARQRIFYFFNMVITNMCRTNHFPDVFDQNVFKLIITSSLGAPTTLYGDVPQWKRDMFSLSKTYMSYNSTPSWLMSQAILPDMTSQFNHVISMDTDEFSTLFTQYIMHVYDLKHKDAARYVTDRTLGKHVTHPENWPTEFREKRIGRDTVQVWIDREQTLLPNIDRSVAVELQICEKDLHILRMIANSVAQRGTDRCPSTDCLIDAMSSTTTQRGYDEIIKLSKIIAHVTRHHKHTVMLRYRYRLLTMCGGTHHTMIQMVNESHTPMFRISNHIFTKVTRQKLSRWLVKLEFPNALANVKSIHDIIRFPCKKWVDGDNVKWKCVDVVKTDGLHVIFQYRKLRKRSHSELQ